MRFDLALGSRLVQWEAQRDFLARGFGEFFAQRYRYLYLRDLPATAVASLSIQQRWRLAVRASTYESIGTAAADRGWQLFHRELAKLAAQEGAPEQSKVRLADGGTNSEQGFLSFILSFAGDHPEESLSTAITTDPGFKEARYQLAKRLVVDGQVEEAIRLMTGVEFLDGDRPRDFASELWRRNHLWEAREVLRYFCAHQPETAANCRMLASITLLLGGREEARSYAARALALDPADHRHWRLLGDVQRAIGEPEKAARFLRMGLDIKKDDPGLLESLSASLMEQGRLEESIQWLERAVCLEPKSESLASLAYARAQKGDLAGAMEAITRAIEKDSGNPRLHILAGDIMVRRGDAMAAQSFFHQAEALAPGAKIQFEGGNLV
jgi:tetratricopeptide (TPR) repeat protein